MKKNTWQIIYTEQDGYTTFRDIIAETGQEAKRIAESIIRDEENDYIPAGAKIRYVATA